MNPKLVRSIVGVALSALTTVASAETGKVEVLWLGQAAVKITSPGGKVIVTDPWLRMNPLTPPEYKKLESFGKLDVLLVTHGHGDPIADALALAQMYNVPVRGPGDLLSTVMTLGVLAGQPAAAHEPGRHGGAGAGHQGDRGARRTLVDIRVAQPGQRQG